MLEEALYALAGDGWALALDRIAAPTYVTDAEGNVTYWNRACVEFAGRTPENKIVIEGIKTRCGYYSSLPADRYDPLSGKKIPGCI